MFMYMVKTRSVVINQETNEARCKKEISQGYEWTYD